MVAVEGEPHRLQSERTAPRTAAIPRPARVDGGVPGSLVGVDASWPLPVIHSSPLVCGCRTSRSAGTASLARPR